MIKRLLPMPPPEPSLAPLNQWLEQPLLIHDTMSIAGILDTLERHPLGQDQTEADYFTPSRRRGKHPLGYEICSENQENWTCFVQRGCEHMPDAPVFFSTHLDLQLDFDIEPSRIEPGPCVQIETAFTAFLIHFIARSLVLRIEPPAFVTSSVSLAQFAAPVQLDSSFICPLSSPFPAGFTTFIGQGVICAPDWGALFLDPAHRDAFIATHKPVLR